MELRIYRERLPHWRLPGATYFVTWRLNVGQPVMSGAERTLVRDTLLFADGRQFELLAHVVMDDHVHLIVTPHIEVPLEKVVHSWRSFTTHEFHRKSGRVGRVWQHDYYDRILRNDDELAQKLEYLLSNPWRRWPGIERYEWMGVRGNDIATW